MYNFEKRNIALLTVYPNTTFAISIITKMVFIDTFVQYYTRNRLPTYFVAVYSLLIIEQMKGNVYQKHTFGIYLFTLTNLEY